MAGVVMHAVWNDTVIAQSDKTVIVEGNHYFPPDSVNMDFLKPSETTSFCGWKGTANYYTLVTPDGKSNRDCAWRYEKPSEDAASIRGMIAFWRGVDVRSSSHN